MKIEALTVCVNYSDFLAETLPSVRHHFDRFVVVTSFEDRQTQALCAHHSVECRVTDLLHRKGDPFAKGRAIDFGFSFLRRDGWVCHLDADIWLPPDTRTILDGLDLDEDCIYGIDRVNCPNSQAWDKFRAGATHQHRWRWMTEPPPFPLGARLSRPEHNGYVPIGFFQLWHGKHERRYPLEQGTAEHTDFLHALQWPTNKRRLITELIGVHLESGPAKMGANWSGRKTPPFRPVSDNGSNAAPAAQKYGQ